MEMIAYDVTCIMPVYNTQKYVKEALLSILQQQGDLSIQIIVVDDGSSDDSVSIIKTLQDSHKNIDLYQQRNSGPAVARNFALSKAEGKYIMFVDSDDLLPENAIKQLHVNIETNKSQIAVGMFEAFNRHRRWKHESMRFFVDVYKASTNLDDFPELINNMSPWNKIYRRDFIRHNKLIFLDNVQLREDIYFVCNALYKAEFITVIPDIVYLYRARDEQGESLTSRINKKVFHDILLVSKKLDEDQKLSLYSNNKQVWHYRYINELHALTYRLWPYIQDNNEVLNIFNSIQKFLQKIGDSVIILFPIDKRIVLYKIKNSEFDVAENLIKITKIQNKSLISKLKDKIYTQLKNLFWKTLFLLRPLLRNTYTIPKNLWLVGEQQGNGASDTGYEFFLYCRKYFPKRAIYFVTKKGNITNQLHNNSEHIISYGSFQNFLYSIAAKVYIFSDGHKDIFPYWTRIKRSSKLKVSVFLQHGIFAFKRSEYYKMSEVTKRDEKFDILIVSSEKEKAYVSDDLGYDKDIIAVTGLSRFDRLFDHQTHLAKKRILFVPTWRTDLRYANEETYLNSLFHSKIGAFITSNFLKNILEYYDYTLNVCFHHAAANFTKYYHASSKHIIFSDMANVDLYHELINANMLITDYSSVAFNMAYINRPVAFYQFDVEEFLVIEGGSFIDYKTDLFGVGSSDPVKIIEEIEYNIKHNFNVRQQYKEKADAFFSYKDNKNSQRIFDTIERHLQIKDLNNAIK